MNQDNSNQSKRERRSKIRWGIAAIFALFIAATLYVVPTYGNKAIDKVNNIIPLGFPHVPEEPFKLGLDLQGGIHLTYEADISKIPEEDKEKAIQAVRDVVERRVSGIGVNNASVRTSRVGDKYRINVELPGIKDKQKAKKKIGKTPILRFKEVSTSTPDRKLSKKQKKELQEFNQKKKEEAEEVLSKVKENKKQFEQLARKHSEDEATKDKGGYMGYVTPSSTKLHKWARGANQGEISEELVENEEGYNILKRGDSKEGKRKVKLSHIKICYVGADGCEDPLYTKSEAKAKAENIFQRASAYNFSDLAEEYSKNKSTSSEKKPGYLGYLSKKEVENKFSKKFASDVFNSRPKILGPVATDNGFHVVYKQDEKVVTKYQLWRILFETQSKEDILPPESPWKKTKLSGAQLEGASVVTDQRTGQVQVSLQFNDEGARLFAEITERNVGKPVGIFLDGKPISTPRVNQVITNGEAVITGNFSVKEAQNLAERLNAGALPVPIELISQQSVGASLGHESLVKSLKAGVVAILLVMLFMVAFYRLPGVLSAVALLIYISLTLALYKLIGVTMTLAGIAGFILSVGMAVDANVLIFERLKEELRAGRALKPAAEEGFMRAWTSIRDGNVSTLITCFMLLMFGTSFVEGFAITLAIGVLLSMFSAITITRLLLLLITPWFDRRGNALFLGANSNNQE
ncbi:MAG: protein translocase subunit SecD [Candidatus Magasanikbacteria bacterium]